MATICRDGDHALNYNVYLPESQQYGLFVHKMQSLNLIGTYRILYVWIFSWFTCFSDRGDLKVHPRQIWCCTTK